MPLARARKILPPQVLREWQRNSLPQTAAPASATDDGSPARTTLFPSRFRPAPRKPSPSPPLSESVGSLPGSRHAPPRSAEIRSASSILRAAADSPVVTPAAARPSAPATSNAPGPPASAENRTRLLSSRLGHLPPIRKASAVSPVWLHPP